MMMFRNPTAGPSIAGYRVSHTSAALMVACVAFIALPGPAAAMQVLDATDHAELEAMVSATGVSRVALANDRIRRVIRSPGGFDVEHDAASGDLYLRPPDGTGPEADVGAALPITLFLGTERGLTYRLTLTPDARPSAQVLIRNAAAVANPMAQAPTDVARDARVAELVRLVRAVARRERMPGYVVEPAFGRRATQTWRGARFTAHVVAAGPDTEAAALARQFGTGVAAAWVASPPGSTDRERTAVVVTEPGRAGTTR
ncbi:MAG: type-F conjugative transfer system secretin TraK [Rhodospirillales bacterium]|nr:type-F conjugative transfer system secretin TraK [Rhodospirillales bacterium]